MSLFKRKRSLTAAEYTNQQNLLRHSAEKGVTSLKILCSKLHSLLHEEPEVDTEAHHTPDSSQDIYHQFLTPDALSTTHHTDNLSTSKRSHARFNKFLNESRIEMGVHLKNCKLVNPFQFRREHQRAHGSEDCFIDGRYLVWLCGFLFEQASDATEGMEQEAFKLLNEWQGSIIDLFTGETEDKIMWRLLLQNLDIEPKTLNDATIRHLNNSNRDKTNMGIYFQWPSFLRNLVLNRQLKLQDENNERGNKRRKSNDGASFSLQSYYQPISLLEMMDPKIQQCRNAWLPLLGYTVTHAYLSRESKCTIHETMDYLQNVLVPSLPSTMGLDSDKKKALLCGMGAYLMDGLGDALAVALLSLKDEEDGREGEDKIGLGENWVGSILGAEVAQVVDLFCVHSVIPTLAKYINCPLAGLVSETAGTLLDYSNVHHRLHHEASPMADDNDAIQQLMAKDAVKLMYFIERTNPQLRRELLVKKFTTQTFNDSKGDPSKHPIVTYLRARLVAGNLDEGSSLCRTLESCTGLDKETERCCWYSLFDKMQEENVLLEHHWEINRGRFVDVPVLDSSGKVTMRRVGNITLANIMIGPFGRTVALEYLHGIIDVAKDELFPGFKSMPSSKSIKSRRQADRDKQYFLALKDAVRRTVLKFLIPRPHSPAETLSIANRVSEADKPPLLKHHAAPPKGQDVRELCCRILQQPSLLKIWEDNEDAFEEEEPAAAHKLTLPPAAAALSAAAHPESPLQEVAKPAAMEEQEVLAEEGGVLDMSMELIPPTPAKTPQKPPAFKPSSPQEDVIELGDSEDEEVVDDDEESNDEGEEDHENDSAAKSFEDSREGGVEEGEYNSNEDYAEENDAAVNDYPAHYHEYPGNYSESDDYDDEDAEEENRRVAFEGPYDAEEGRGTRGNSSSGGSVEVFDLMSSSDEEQEEAPDESIPHAEAVENDSSPEEEPTETEILNEVVDDYIGAAAAQPTEVQLPEVNDGKILHDNVTEYIAVSSPSKKSPEKVARSTTADSADTAVASDEVAAEITNNATEDDAQAVGECYRNQASIGADVETNNANQAPLSDEKPELDPIDTRSKNALEHTSDEIQELHEEADKSEPYSSDGGNLGEELSEDMADDEHESLDTEDDKRSLAEQGETFDEEEAGPSSPVHFDANEDSDAMMETDQPSILVAAAMSSQHQGSSSYPMVMTKSYRRSSLKSVDNVAAADNEINDRELAPESSALRPEHTSTKEPIDLMGSDNDVQGGALTDDGYVPDVELTEEEKIEKKKVRTIEDGYVPDAEATEEESSKPIAVGNKAVKRRDVRFEAVLETREAPSFPPPPIEPAANQSTEIDDGYIPEGALTEEEKRERHERRSRSVEEGYLPDATDDDTVEKKARRSPHRKGILNEAEAIDPGYLPSAVEGTEEERSEEESQEAVASVLVATALVTQKGKMHASDIANKASLATARIAKPKFSTQSIDDGYVPDGTFDDEERTRLRKETRSQYVEEGYLPDGHTTPGEATEDDQPDEKPKLLLDAKMKLSESIAGKNRNRDAKKLADTQVPPPPEPAASLSIDDGYVPSGVEEERSEEEDALTVKATHDTEEESIAIDSSANVTEKHSKSDNETAAATESKDADDVADDVAEMKGAIKDQKSPSAKRDTDANAEPEPETEDPSFQPITCNPLLITAQADPPKTETPSPDKVVTGAVAKQESPKPKRGSKREAKAKKETPTQPKPDNDGDVRSVQSETSSVRRSSRIKTKSAAPSPKVPSSIVTGSRAGKKAAPSLPAVPENEKLDELIEVIQEAAASGRKGTRTTASEGASTMNDDIVTVSSRTRRGKRGTDAEVGASNASVNDESKASTSKRAKAGSAKKASGAKRKQDDDEVNDGDETKVDAPEPVPSPPTKKRKGRTKKNDNVSNDAEVQKDEAPETVSSPPTKARRGRSKKDDNSVDVQQDVSESVSRPQTRGRGRAKKTVDDVSESVASQPKTRSVRLKKKTALQDNVSELTASPPTKTRRGRAKKNDADAVVQDDVSESVSSPPKTRSGRPKKNQDDDTTALKDDVSESVASSVRRTRSTAPSEGSLASTRSRRNTKAPKRY